MHAGDWSRCEIKHKVYECMFKILKVGKGHCNGIFFLMLFMLQFMCIGKVAFRTNSQHSASFIAMATVCTQEMLALCSFVKKWNGCKFFFFEVGITSR